MVDLRLRQARTTTQKLPRWVIIHACGIWDRLQPPPLLSFPSFRLERMEVPSSIKLDAALPPRGAGTNFEQTAWPFVFLLVLPLFVVLNYTSRFRRLCLVRASERWCTVLRQHVSSPFSSFLLLFFLFACVVCGKDVTREWLTLQYHVETKNKYGEGDVRKYVARGQGTWERRSRIALHFRNLPSGTYRYA